MKIDTRLTKSDVFDTAALAVVDGIDTEAESVPYRPKVLTKWAEQLEDVEGDVFISLQELESRDGAHTTTVLTAHAEGTRVAAVAMPLEYDEDDEESSGERIEADSAANLEGWR